MEYACEIEINLPRKTVIGLFDNPDNLSRWQEGFISFEPLEGEPGAEGSTARLKYKMGKREIEMTETITLRHLPDEFNATYETKGVFNIIENQFIDLGNSTKWISHNEFQFKGLMKLMAFMMPGAFKKQSLKFMQDFKKFAESQSEVSV